MTKIHLIKDAELGGIEREYVEVDRKAVVGDYVYIYQYGNESENKAAKITDTDLDGDLITEDYEHYLEDWDEFVTLEPTDIIQVDGERFKLVERKAEVGEKVVIIYGDADHNGSVGEVVFDYGCSISVDIGDDFPYYPYVNSCDYHVLEPVDNAEPLTVDETSSKRELIDLIANLARRVTELEECAGIDRLICDEWTEEIEHKIGKLVDVSEQLRDTQRNVETWAQEIENIKHDLQYYRDDFLACGSAIEHLDEKVEMVIDDIVTLDERTQPLACRCKGGER